MWTQSLRVTTSLAPRSVPSHALGMMEVVTRDQQVSLIGHYLVHIVCNLHDALLGVAQVEVLVPVLQRDRDRQGSPDEEQGGR